MKKILMICLALVMGLGMCAAAGKPAQKKEVTVIYDASKNNDENIVKGFATIKVKAEPKKAPAKK